MNLVLTKIWTVQAFPERQYAETAARRIGMIDGYVIVSATDSYYACGTRHSWTAKQT